MTGSFEPGGQLGPPAAPDRGEQGHRNIAKGHFGAAYVHAIAAAAGMGVDIAGQVLDAAGVDLMVVDRPPPGGFRGSMLAVQVKCTATEPEADALVVDLPVKNYNALREPTRQVPMILVVVVVPSDPEAWLQQTEEALVARRCAWWCSLEGQATSENQATQRIRIPRAARFTREALRTIMAQIAEGGAP